MVQAKAIPARVGVFFERFWLTLIGVHSGHDNRRPLRPVMSLKASVLS